MTDPLSPPSGINSRLPLRALSPVSKICTVLLLLTVVATGCSDSHSDEYVEFADLEQNTEPVETTSVAEPTQSPQGPKSQEPVTTTGAINTVSVGTVTDNTDSTDSTDSADDTALADDTIPADDDQPDSDADEEPDASEQDVADSAATQPIKLLIPHRQFRKEGDALRATFDDIDLLKVLNMDPVPVDAADHFPDWLNQLNGAHVRIRGYMRPGFEDEDITEFLFVRDNGECCYGPLPKIYDMIAVQLRDGESTDLIDGTPFDVEGTFRIDPHADEVELFALFFIDDGVILE